MSIIKCPECGRDISNAAAQCPHCGFPIKKSEGSFSNVPVKNQSVVQTKRKTKKVWAISGIFFVAILLVLVCVWMFKGSSINSLMTTNYPPITEKGIEPFVLGASMKDIPYKGDYYDTIVFKTMYLVAGVSDGEVYEWDDQQWEEYKKSDEHYNEGGWAYNEIISTHINCSVVSASDTLMLVLCDSDLKIIGIKIISDRLQFENGIRVGLSSTELFSKYNAEYACETDTRCMGNMAPPTMGYITPGISNTVGLIAAKKNNITFDVREKYEDNLPIYPVHGTMKHDGIWVMPWEDVKNDYLAYIIIAKDAYPQIYEFPDSFFNMLLK